MAEEKEHENEEDEKKGKEGYRKEECNRSEEKDEGGGKWR